MSGLTPAERTILADLRAAHPEWDIRRAYDAVSEWVAVRDHDVIRADLIETLGVRVRVAEARLSGEL